MKQIYLFFFGLLCYNLAAQSTITRIDYNSFETYELAKARRSQTRAAQAALDKLNEESTVVGNAALPAIYRHKSKKLVLNGAGLREMLWVDLYACGLYLTKRNKNSLNIVSTNESMIMRLDILSNAISKKKLVKAFKKGFEKANTKRTADNYKSELNEFVSFLDVEVSVGDKYDIVYTPGEGTSLYVNYKKKGTIEGLPFKSAIFNMWLSNTPADKNLKSKLLGD